MFVVELRNFAIKSFR